MKINAPINYRTPQVSKLLKSKSGCLLSLFNKNKSALIRVTVYLPAERQVRGLSYNYEVKY